MKPGLTPFTGRTEEAAMLRSHVEGAVRGQGGLVLVAGEAGVGKTRLVSELAVYAADRGLEVLRGRAYETAGMPPYLPFTGPLGEYIRGRTAEELRDELDGNGPYLARLLPELRHLLPDLDEPPSLSPERERYRLFEGLSDWLLRIASAKPVLLHLDDLHWADESSQLLLRHLAPRLDESPLLVVASYRDSEAEPLASLLAELRRERLATTVVLRPFGREETPALLEAILGQPVAPKAARAIFGASEGNPFFSEELVWHLRAQGVDLSSAEHSVESWEVPEGVKQVIAGRLARLSAEANRLLSYASVLGRDLTLGKVAAVTGRDESDALDLLEEGLAGHVLREAPEGFVFAHPLIRETLYEELSATRRRQLHRRTAEALEALYGADVEPQQRVELAHHFCEAAAEGEDVDRAIDYARGAAEQAASQAAYGEAARLHQLAHRVLELKSEPSLEERYESLLGLGDAQADAGRPEVAAKAFEQAIELARTMGSPQRLAWAVIGLRNRNTYAQSTTFEPQDHLRALCEEALGRLDEQQDTALYARMLAIFSTTLEVDDLSDHLSGRALELARLTGDADTLTSVLSCRLMAVWRPDNAEERLGLAREVLQRVPTGEGWGIYYWVVLSLMQLDKVDEAREELETLIRLARHWKHVGGNWLSTHTRAAMAILDGRLEEAERLVHEALEIGSETGDQPSILGAFSVQLGFLRYLQGRLLEIQAWVDDLPPPELRDLTTVQQAAISVLHVELGQEAAARRLFDGLAAHGFTDIPRTYGWLYCMTFLSWTCTRLADVRNADHLYELLLPYAKQRVVLAGALFHVAVAQVLGRLAATMRRWEDAERHFEVALAMDARAGARPFLAHTQHHYAQMLLARDERGDRDKALGLLNVALASAREMGMKALEQEAHELLESHEGDARVRDPASAGRVLLTSSLPGLVGGAPEHVLEPQVELALELTPRDAEISSRALPVETSSFVGREAEIAAVEKQLEQSALVTLVGAGGSGKTRLALRLAHTMRDAEGASWVEVAELRDPELVATAVAKATGAGKLSAASPVADLAGRLARRRALVVLDNCEHLIEACAELAAALRAGCPGLRLLVTSREPLGVPDETIFRVPPLAVPPESADPDEVGAAEAAQLLCQRAADVNATFSLTEGNALTIARICRRLDGLPLALELAAARLRVLSPEQVLKALTDRFQLLTGGSSGLERHRTLEASVEWSYGLLSDDERTALRRLSVFPRSFDLAAAESVCADEEIAPQAVLDLLTRLVDRSLVGAEVGSAEARYSLPETIRAYARERLAERDEAAAVRGRHLEHYARLLGELRPRLDTEDPRPALERVETELANVRAALDWSVESGRAAAAIDMLESSQAFWAMRGLQPEMYERLATALEAEGLDDATRARGYVTAASSASQVGEVRTAIRFAEPGLELARSGDDRETLCDALTCWGSAAWHEAATTERCLAALEEACALAEQLGDPVRLWQAVLYRGTLRNEILGASRGTRDLERAVSLAQQIGAPQLIATSHAFLAAGYRTLLRLEEAREQATLALQRSEGLMVGPPVAVAHASLAWVEMLYGDLDAAAAQHERAREAAFVAGRRLGVESIGDLVMDSPELQYRRRSYTEARHQVEAGIAGSRARGSSGGVSACLMLAGLLDLEAGDRAGARRHLEEAAAIARLLGVPRLVGSSELGLAYLARVEGELEAAWAHAHEALAAADQSESPAPIAITLEEVGGLAAGRGRAELGARLLGAAERVLRDLPGVRRPIEQAALADALAAARDALGEEAFAPAFENGRDLSLGDAVALAGRGRRLRSRPTAGWDSLTPAELDVARLVAAGLSNTNVAKKLFVSVNTVKTHLAHAYGKLGFSTRTELAAEAARRLAN